MNGMSPTTIADVFARDGLRVMEHVLHRHRQRAVVAEHARADAVADEQDLDARLLEPRGRKSYAVTTVISSPRRFSSTIVGAVIFARLARSHRIPLMSARPFSMGVCTSCPAVRQDAPHEVLVVPMRRSRPVNCRSCSRPAAACRRSEEEVVVGVVGAGDVNLVHVALERAVALRDALHERVRCACRYTTMSGFTTSSSSQPTRRSYIASSVVHEVQAREDAVLLNR